MTRYDSSESYFFDNPTIGTRVSVGIQVIDTDGVIFIVAPKRARVLVHNNKESDSYITLLRGQKWHKASHHTFYEE